MKRSEMLEKIEYLLSVTNPDFLSADDVLKFIEDAGMKPPETPTYGPNGQLWNYMSIWEDE